MRVTKIPIGLDGSAQPCDRLFVVAEPVLRGTRDEHRSKGGGIVRAEPEGFKDMAFGFLGACLVCATEVCAVIQGPGHKILRPSLRLRQSRLKIIKA